MRVIKGLEKKISETQVIMLVGGLGKRFGMPELPKALVKVAGKTLIEREIELYRNCGFRKFKLLIGHQGEKIRKFIGDGSKFDIEVEYSEDPKVPKVGKGKALKNAIENGVIDIKKRGIITFPDDLKLDKFLPIKLLAHHLYGVEKFDTWATVLLISSTTYPYGVAKLDTNGLIIGFEEKPKISMPTHVGVSVIEPKVYEIIMNAVDINAPKSIEYEAAVLPIIAKKRKLFSMMIPGDDRSVWIPINTRKELEIAEEILKKIGEG